MVELISVHVPKTAGTAFSRILARNYGSNAIHLEYDGKTIDSLAEDSRAPLRVIHGHFNVRRYEGRFPEAKRIAWMRHPVKWMISFYYYSKRGARIENNFLRRTLHDNQLSLADFIELPRAKNIQSKSFLGRDPLANFFFVGVQEHFDEDLKTLGAMLEWPYVEAPRDNPNVEPGYREVVKRHLGDPALVRRIEELNAIDMEVYDQVLEMRARRPPVVRTTEPLTWVEPRRPLTLARGLNAVRALVRRARAA